MELALFRCEILKSTGIPKYFKGFEMYQMNKDNFKLPQIWVLLNCIIKYVKN